MRYDIPDLVLQTLFSATIEAEDRLARLDERAGRHPVAEGFRERGQFFDAAGALWVAGELVHVEDLVLHDAHMDARAPTHELTIAHAVVRARRRIWLSDPGWALSPAGLAVLRGEQVGFETPSSEMDRPPETVDEDDVVADGDDDANPLSLEFAEIDAAIARSQRLLDEQTGELDDSGFGGAERPTSSEPKGQLGLLFDDEWDEGARLDAWRSLIPAADRLPACLGAAILFDAWEQIEPLRRQHWLGGLLVGAYLRTRGKVTSHLISFHTGLKTIRHERRRARDQEVRLRAFLEALVLTGELGLKELDRLFLAKTQMEMRVRDRRSNSSLPSLIELLLSRPIVSAGLVARHVGVTQRGALNLVRELGAKEMTGRGRYRGWGIL
ncbi:RHE_PE00001 family protein [Ensifer canadensis]